MEVRASGPARRLASAVDDAFREVARVQDLMSFHDPASDVSRLNRQAARRSVRVSPQTWGVLSAARAVSEASGGAFDVTVAPRLVRWGYLPPPSSRPAPRGRGFRSVQLLPGFRVRFLDDVWVDLGGIAKGHAVDRACAALESHGVFDYVVNAGGDLRIGRSPEVLWARHPRAPQKLVRLGTFRRAGVATSAPYFSRKRWLGRPVHPIVSPETGRPAPGAGSLTVVADTCMIGDALTKVAAVLGKDAAPILRRFSSRALWISHD